MKAYQVLNKHGYPATRGMNNLVIFPDVGSAEFYIDFLKHETGDVGFRVVPVRVKHARLNKIPDYGINIVIQSDR